MLRIEELTFRYNRRNGYVLRGIDLELPAGEIGVLLGKNGSGKTTLFKNILGICRPQSGRMEIEGRELSRLSARERAGLVAYVPQIITFGDLSVFDSVLMGRTPAGLRKGKGRHPGGGRLAEMGLEDSPRGMSTGFRRAAEGGDRPGLAQQPRLLVRQPTGTWISPRAEDRRGEKAGAGVITAVPLHDRIRPRLGDRFFHQGDGSVCRRRDSLQEVTTFLTPRYGY